MQDKEALSRIKINDLLTVAGWRLLDDEKARKNVICETTVRTHKKTKNADYLLLDTYNRPVAVVEAKAPNINPLSAKIQAKNYAEGMKAPFIYLSNGDKHYFWDIASGNPEEVTKFHTASELMTIRDNKSTNIFNDNTELWEYPVDEYILAELQDPKLKAKQFSNKDLKNRYIAENKLIRLRDYQVEAVNAVQES